MVASVLLYLTAHRSQDEVSFGNSLIIYNWNFLEAEVKLTHVFETSNLTFHCLFLSVSRNLPFKHAISVMNNGSKNLIPDETEHD